MIIHAADIRVVVITNALAGQAVARAEAVTNAVSLWRAQGWDVSVRETTKHGDAERYAHEAVAAGVHIVIPAGGDGTVNEVANGLVGSTTILAPLPIGTVNVWAREAGFSMDVATAAVQILTAQRSVIDVGKCGDRFFVLMAGIGFDAAVVQHLYARDKRRFGVMAYIGRIWSVMWGYRGQHVRVQLDDEVFDVSLLMMIVGNTARYASFIPFTPDAAVDDGMLDVYMLVGADMLSGPFRFLALYLKRIMPFLDPHGISRRVRTVTIDGTPIAMQLDGDHVGTTPARITIQPSALHVLVTHGAAQTLRLAPWGMEKS
jgi:YegS/Rv2252/BmrU family lipid kinase